MTLLINPCLLVLFILQGISCLPAPGYGSKLKCPLDVRVERPRVIKASSDRELFPSLRHGPGGPQQPQPPLAQQVFKDEDHIPSHSDNYDSNARFYDSSYGFSKEALAGLITKGTDYSSAEPSIIDDIPPENSAYSNEYQNNFEKFSELGGKGVRNEPNRYDPHQQIDSKFAGTHETPVNLFKTFIQQVERNNRSSLGKNNDRSKRPLPAFDSPEYPYRFREGLNFNSFPKVGYNFQVSDVVEKQHPNDVKNQRYLGEQFGENIRASVGKYKQGVPQQFSSPGSGSDAAPETSREISALLKQSHALGEYLHRLKLKAEADLASDTEERVRENVRPTGRSKGQGPQRGGRAAFRGRIPHKFYGA